jgi:hypothetical protein
MITTLGKRHIKRFLARDVATIGGAIACGVNPAAAAVGDTSLYFETIRVNVHLTTYDFVQDRLIFKATLPVEYAGTIYETGLWSLSVDSSAGNYGSKMLSTFSAAEGWSGVSDTTNTGRVGIDSLKLSAGASATTTDTREQFLIDLSGYSSGDQFKLAYQTTTANTSSVFVRLMTDGSNYYQFQHAPGAVPGYHLATWNKSTATVTGTPSWQNITAMTVGSTATAGGTSDVYFDAFRVEDVDPFNTEYVLISRTVLGSPIVKIAGKTLDIEYSMAVNV